MYYVLKPKTFRAVYGLWLTWLYYLLGKMETKNTGQRMQIHEETCNCTQFTGFSITVVNPGICYLHSKQTPTILND